MVTVTITNKRLNDSQQAIQALGSLTLSAKPLFAVQRAIRKYRAACEDFQASNRVLIEKYGERDAKGKLVSNPNNGVPKFKPEEIGSYLSDLDDLLKEKAEIHVTLIPASLFGDQKFNPGFLADLDWLIEDDLEEKEVSAKLAVPAP